MKARLLRLMRSKAIEVKKKKRNEGIYRKSYLDKDDLDKKGEPKKKFNYFYLKDDSPVNEEVLARIKKLGIPPAWREVWVDSDPLAKIQAIGFDDKNRKQYRYSAAHTEKASEDKFLRLYKFMKAIPELEKAIEKDIQLPDYTQKNTMALMLLVIKAINIRVGKEYYAKTNKSYGLTSLKKSHLKIENGKAILRFKAKSGKKVSYTITDPLIIKEFESLLKLEGDKLFQYISEAGNILRVTSDDLNKYIQSYIGRGFSAKDFRTYAANYYFLDALLDETRKRKPKNKKTVKQNLSNAQERTAFRLRHTKAISKKSYVVGIIRQLYTEEPDYFVKHKGKAVDWLLLRILKRFRDQIVKKRKEEKQRPMET